MFYNIGQIIMLFWRTIQALPKAWLERKKVYDQLFEIGNASLLMVILSRRIGGLDEARVWRSFLKIFTASVVMALAAYYAEALLHAWLPAPRLVPRVVRVFGAIGAGLGVLVMAAHLLRLEEFSQAMGRVLDRFRIRREPPA